ncbi:MAG: recombinase family protein [Deltaproteobacteria bacterium]|nr:recombinase family protein [Deltaproteobacteria bacterium]
MATISSRAFGFARVSSEDQARGGISLGLQTGSIRAYCDANGLDLVKTWEVAETATFDDERVEFQAMLREFAASGDVPHLVFHKVDRSNRNSWDHARLEDLVKRHGKHLHAALDRFHLHADAPPSEWDRFEMMAMFARSETRHLSARVKSCIRQQTSLGYWSYKAPPGYRKVPRTGIEPDPVQGPLVRELLEAAATGNYSLDVLVKESKRLGITYQDKPISRSALHRWLVDPVFAGPFYAKGKLVTNFQHEPLIDMETHERIRLRLSDTRRTEKKIREPRPLSGVFQCAECGHSVTFFAAKKGKYTYGFCGTCKRNGNRHAFLAESEALRRLDGIARRAILPPAAAGLLMAGLDEFRSKAHEVRAAKRAALEARLDVLKRKLARAFEAMTSGDVDSATYREQTGALRAERDRAEIGLRELEREETHAAADQVEAAYKLAEELETTLDSASPRALARISKILCTNLQVRNGTVEYSLAFPFDLIAEGNKGGDWRRVWDSNPR